MHAFVTSLPFLTGEGALVKISGWRAFRMLALFCRVAGCQNDADRVGESVQGRVYCIRQWYLLQFVGLKKIIHFMDSSTAVF